MDVRDSTSLLCHGWVRLIRVFIRSRNLIAISKKAYIILYHTCQVFPVQKTKKEGRAAKGLKAAALSACYLYFRHLRTCRDVTVAKSGLEPESHGSGPWMLPITPHCNWRGFAPRPSAMLFSSLVVTDNQCLIAQAANS